MDNDTMMKNTWKVKSLFVVLIVLLVEKFMFFLCLKIWYMPQTLKGGFKAHQKNYIC